MEVIAIAVQIIKAADCQHDTEQDTLIFIQHLQFEQPQQHNSDSRPGCSRTGYPKSSMRAAYDRHLDDVTDIMYDTYGCVKVQPMI